MTKDELIAKQQLEIEETNAKAKANMATLKKLKNSFYCIGAPLNDNALKMDKEQLMWCARLVELIDEIEL